MALKSNIFANYVSFAYVSLIGVVVTPPLYRALGEAGYGVVGFYALLQAWFVLLDLGLSAALSRTCSRYRGGAVSAVEMISTFRVIERVFWSIGLSGALALVLLSDLIAKKWLDLEGESAIELSFTVRIIGSVIALRWISGLYRAVINGFEKQVWVSGFGGFVATLRFPAAYLIVEYSDLDVTGFFGLQLAIAGWELLMLQRKAKEALPSVDRSLINAASGDNLLRFSSGVFVVALTNTAILQIDKILLLKKIGLAEFGQFSVMMMMVNIVGMVSGPISSALIPALSRVYAERKSFKFYILYSSYWQLCVVVIGAIALMLSIYSENVLYVWTGDARLSESMAEPLRYYVIGNALFSLGAYAHYVQFAKGDLALQLRYNFLFLLSYAPIVLGAVCAYGASGAAIAWAACSTVGFVVITSTVHHRFMRPGYAIWMKNHFISSLAPMLLLAFATKPLVGLASGRTAIFFNLAIVSLMLIAAGVVCSRKIRRGFASLRLYARLFGN